MNEPLLPSIEDLVRRSEIELDWPLLLEQIAQYAVSAGAARCLRARRPEVTHDAARDRMLLTREVLEFYASGEALPVEDIPDTLELLDRIERGTIATGLELRDVARLLEQARRLRVMAQRQQHRRPILAAALHSDDSLERIAVRLASSLEPDGSLSDTASPELARARRKAGDARRELMSQLKRMLGEYADILRESYWAERDGRFVLPLRADAHRSLEGAVLDTSSSGGTLYVEPRELLPFNNRLRMAEADVYHEEQRILRQLCELIARSLLTVRAAERACVGADELHAIARYGECARAVAIIPEATPLIELHSARHPLLAARSEVVANDIALQAGTALVISGPNAGGKTVILKQVGLAAWMVRAGIPLPAAEDSRMGWFETVLCNLGDSQSITASLSTYSAHVAELSAILNVASPAALVLLDEVAAGTDPEEGAALAAAVLEAMAQRGATVIATTHHEPLKDLAMRHPQLRSAAVGFDLNSMLPTFRLLPNVAGPSTALAVASRFGMPQEVVARARALIPETSLERDRLLRELHAERSMAEEARRGIEAELVKQRALRLEIEQQQSDFDAKESRELQAKYRDLVGAVVRARSDLTLLEKRLKRENAGISELREAEQVVDSAAHIVAMGSPVSNIAQGKQTEGSKWRQPRPDEVFVGRKVRVPKWGVVAEVIEVTAKGEVRVTAGALRAQFRPEELQIDTLSAPVRRSEAEPRPARSRAGKSSTNGPAGRATPVRVDSNTLDLRGIRVDEGLDQVDAFVDKMLSAGEPAAFVLHGHGTGAMKRAVREHLRDSLHVSDSAPAEADDGGDAFTVFWLPT